MFEYIKYRDLAALQIVATHCNCRYCTCDFHVFKAEWTLCPESIVTKIRLQ